MFKVIKRITALAGEYRKNLVYAYIASMIEAICVKIPVFMILYALLKITGQSLSSKDVWIILAFVCVSLVVGVVCRYIRDENQGGSGFKIFERERMKLGDRIKKFPMSYFSKGNIGNLTAVVGSDIRFIEVQGMGQLSSFTTAIITIVVTVVMLAFFSPVIAVVVTVTAAITAVIFAWIQKIAIEHSNKVQDAQTAVVGAVIEYVKGMQVIKAFHLVGDNHEKMNRCYKKLTDEQIAFEKNFIVPLKLAESILALGVGAIIFAACYSNLTGTMALATMLMLVVFSFEIFLPIRSLFTLSGEMRVTETCLDRYEKALDEKAIYDTEKEVVIKDHSVEFRNVSFAYDEVPVIQNMSFMARGKSMTALVGKSGCGKTTVTNLIARFWDVTSGEILIGGINIRDMSYEQLITNISMVFQSVYLFNDTVYNNIAFGSRNTTKDQIYDAAKKARCYDFIMEMPEGFDTVIGEGGATLSGGEKQRISIARAILKDAPIILLDEATASVDPDNEHHIQAAINELISNKTLIVIAHKLFTIKEAQQILVIDGGRITQSGTHDELITAEGLYKKLWSKREKSRSWKIK